MKCERNVFCMPDIDSMLKDNEMWMKCVLHAWYWQCVKKIMKCEYIALCMPDIDSMLKR